jgi:hypothetical protein
LEFGTAIHMGIQGYLSGDDGRSMFALYWEILKNEEIEWGRLGWQDLGAVGDELLRKFHKNYLPHFKPVALEERIYGEVNGHPFEGTPDFLGYYKELPVIADWKTSGYRYLEERTISDEQMPAYAHLVEQQTSFKPTHYMHLVLVKSRTSPSIQTPIIVPLTNTTVCSTMENVKQQIEDLKTRTTFPRNTSQCVQGERVCPFFNQCYKRKDAE